MLASIKYMVRAEHQDQNYAEAYIDLINTIQSTMPSNRTFNDIDLVQPTQYNVRLNRVAKKLSPEPWPLPDFMPLAIDDFDDHGTPNLPPRGRLRNTTKGSEGLYQSSHQILCGNHATVRIGRGQCE